MRKALGKVRNGVEATKRAVLERTGIWEPWSGRRHVSVRIDGCERNISFRSCGHGVTLGYVRELPVVVAYALGSNGPIAFVSQTGG